MATSAKRYVCLAILLVCCVAPLLTPKVACDNVTETKAQQDNEDEQCDAVEEEEEPKPEQQPVISGNKTNSVQGYQFGDDPPRFNCQYHTHGEPCAYQSMCGIAPGVRYIQRGKNQPRRLKQRRRGYIVGGKAVGVGEFPFFAQVGVKVREDKDESFCSGVIVSSQHVFTAAHCVVGEDLHTPVATSVVSVHVAALQNFPRPDENRRTYKVSKICITPRYNEGLTPHGDHYDVAVLRLDRKLEFDGRVQPACWPYEERGHIDTSEDSECYVIGVGLRGFANNNLSEPILTHELRKTRVMGTECDRKNPNHYSNFCVKSHPTAPFNERGVACNGDSGGPMLCRDRYLRWVVVGLVGYVQGLCGLGTKTGIRKINRGMSEVLLTSTTCAVGGTQVPPAEPKECNQNTDGTMCKYYHSCGIDHQVGGYMINGRPLQRNEAPFLVRVVNLHSRTTCVGTLVDQMHVVTSATCLEMSGTPSPLTDIQVFVGPERQEYIVIARCRAKRRGSLTMLTLGNIVQLSDTVQPACWNYKSRRFITARKFECVVYGLGATNVDGTNMAQQVTKILVNEVNCDGQEQASMCFRPLYDAAGACMDAGAPVVCRDANHQWTLVAMVEPTKTCREYGLVYATEIESNNDHNLAKCRD